MKAATRDKRGRFRASKGGPAALKAAQEKIRQLAGEKRVLLRASYDAAKTTPDNYKHWAPADGLSANALNSAETRRILRNRSRYEASNNSYLQGIALTVANDTIGTGPRLQLTTGAESENANVERLFAEWSDAVDLAGKLRTARLAKLTDGEAFALLTTNPRLPTPVSLDLRLVEADQVASPWTTGFTQQVDGIRFDAYGNPDTYQVLRSHPGDTHVTGIFAFDNWPAAAVLHYYTEMRPGQARGIPEITPALLLFGQLRRYTIAVIAAAEAAADFAIVIQSAGAASEESLTSPEAMDTIELTPRMATVLPEGWNVGQAKPEQPTTTYDGFTKAILNEIARCLNVPFNVAAGNSAGYNYSSGRLDHQVYFKSLHVERARIRRTILDRIFGAWIDEASLIEGYLPQTFRRLGSIPHTWFWDGQEHVDPAKEASAQATRLQNMTTTLAAEFGRVGKDWQVELRQRAAELRLMAELGLSLPTPTSQPTPTTIDEDDDDIDEDE